MAVSKSEASQAMKVARSARLARKRAAALTLNASDAPKAKRVSISLRAETFRAVSSRPDSMAALIETYGHAFEKSRRGGRSVQFTVDIAPNGELTIAQVEGGRPKPVQESDAKEDDLDVALAAARARGSARVAEILSSADMLSAERFAELIGTSRVTVNVKRRNCQVLALEGAKRGFRFPEWQIGEDGKPFAALPELFDRLGGSPWAVYRFLVQHHPELDGETGREALRRGRTARVIGAAESVAQNFA